MMMMVDGEKVVDEILFHLISWYIKMRWWDDGGWDGRWDGIFLHHDISVSHSTISQSTISSHHFHLTIYHLISQSTISSHLKPKLPLISTNLISLLIERRTLLFEIVRWDGKLWDGRWDGKLWDEIWDGRWDVKLWDRYFYDMVSCETDYENIRW